MDFQERLRTVMTEGRTSAESARQADHLFVKGWDASREIVRKVLHESKEPIRSGFGDADVTDENGCTVLVIKHRGERGEREFKLIFCAERVTRKVVCKASPESLTEESFDLETFTREVVEGKVVAFVRAIFALLESQCSR